MDTTDTLSPTDIKTLILDDPSLVLGDAEVMRALLDAERPSGARNVVDLRGVLVDRLENRIGQLQDKHREVLAAAYDNVSGTNQIHRACLALLEAQDFPGFLAQMTTALPDILAVDIVRLALVAPNSAAGAPIGPEGALAQTVVAMPTGGVEAYITQGRGLGARVVTLRQLSRASSDLYGDMAPEIQSEAILKLDLGAGAADGLLAFGSCDMERFDSEQGTDLLNFFTGVVERVLQRWIT